MPHVFLTIDTELVWRHHAAGLPIGTVTARSFEPAGVGITHQLALLAAHRLKATFFVDPMPALVYGIAPIRAIVSTILAAGQEVQLHLHASWRGASQTDRRVCGRELTDHDLAGQRRIIAQAIALLEEAGAPRPVAFRGGCYGANDTTLEALATLGIAYDSSHNGAAHPHPSAIGLRVARIAPVLRCGVIEVPVTVIEDRPGALRPFQICALSQREQQAALDHAIAAGHVVTTIVGHSFELAIRTGLRANIVHERRFLTLCEALSMRRDVAPTAHFRDRPALALGRRDVPLPPDALRLRMRQAEQLWSNLVDERAM